AGRRARVEEADRQPARQLDRLHAAVTGEADRAAEHRGRDVGSAAATLLGDRVGLAGDAGGGLANLWRGDVEAGGAQVPADHRSRDRGARAEPELAGAGREPDGGDHRDRGHLGDRMIVAAQPAGHQLDGGGDERAAGIGPLVVLLARPMREGPDVDGGDHRFVALEHRVLADQERLAGRRDRPGVTGPQGTRLLAHDSIRSRLAAGPGATACTSCTPPTSDNRAAGARALAARHRTFTWGPASEVTKPTGPPRSRSCQTARMTSRVAPFQYRSGGRVANMQACILKHECSITSPSASSSRAARARSAASRSAVEVATQAG